MNKDAQFTDAILDTKTGMLHFNEQPVMALIAEDGIKVIPGGMTDICQLQVTFFIRSYGEVDRYGEALAKFKDGQKMQRENLKKLFDAPAREDQMAAIEMALRRAVTKQYPLPQNMYKVATEAIMKALDDLRKEDQ